MCEWFSAFSDACCDLAMQFVQLCKYACVCNMQRVSHFDLAPTPSARPHTKHQQPHICTFSTDSTAINSPPFFLPIMISFLYSFAFRVFFFVPSRTSPKPMTRTECRIIVCCLWCDASRSVNISFQCIFSMLLFTCRHPTVEARTNERTTDRIQLYCSSAVSPIWMAGCVCVFTLHRTCAHVKHCSTERYEWSSEVGANSLWYAALLCRCWCIRQMLGCLASVCVGICVNATIRQFIHEDL